VEGAALSGQVEGAENSFDFGVVEADFSVGELFKEAVCILLREVIPNQTQSSLLQQLRVFRISNILLIGLPTILKHFLCFTESINRFYQFVEVVDELCFPRLFFDALEFDLLLHCLEPRMRQHFPRLPPLLVIPCQTLSDKILRRLIILQDPFKPHTIILNSPVQVSPPIQRIVTLFAEWHLACEHFED